LRYFFSSALFFSSVYCRTKAAYFLCYNSLQIACNKKNKKIHVYIIEGKQQEGREFHELVEMKFEF